MWKERCCGISVNRWAAKGITWCIGWSIKPALLSTCHDNGKEISVVKKLSCWSKFKARVQAIHRGDGLERNDISYVLIILHVLQAPAVDATGTFPFLKRMADHYNRVPKSATSRQLRDKLRDQGLDKLLEDSASGPMKGFNSCKYMGEWLGMKFTWTRQKSIV